MKITQDVPVIEIDGYKAVGEYSINRECQEFNFNVNPTDGDIEGDFIVWCKHYGEKKQSSEVKKGCNAAIEITFMPKDADEETLDNYDYEKFYKTEKKVGDFQCKQENFSLEIKKILDSFESFVIEYYEHDAESPEQDIANLNREFENSRL